MRVTHRVLKEGIVKIDKTWLVAGALIAAALAWRVANWNLGIAPNLELVTASALVAATFLTWRLALIVPLAVMAAGDLLIGNSPILFFTWSAFAAIGLGGLLLRRLKGSPGKLMLAATGAGVAGSVVFFLWTNFGVWLLADGTVYARSWVGLMESYVMGFPFYRTMLLGNLVIVPAYFAAAIYGPALVRRVSARLRPVEVRVKVESRQGR